ncbi:Endo-1,3(4)-beta-glucanase [Colletotrichum sidae]|uniref:Endo-1,3(4)-beta-glucanase n=1 Tax=Colletotrichum sidae TaxID=1347389 RepID=A0A4V3I483_9PEZI|nr:Endo-1,3(4)-beta-glucanase [Colletotrichum sidae]
MAPSFFTLGTAALALAGDAAARQFVLEDTYDSSNFFDKFDFFESRYGTGNYNDVDLTSGYINYRNRADAKALGLINSNNGEVYLGVDNTTVTRFPGVGRNSVRLESKSLYNKSLMVARFSHLPKPVCGAWSAFWSYGAPWPTKGELDWFEGWNNQASKLRCVHNVTAQLTTPKAVNKPAAHTYHSSEQGECTISSTGQTATVDTPNCDQWAPGQYQNQGCTTTADKSDPWGSSQGGIYAVERTDEYIKFFSWHQAAAPKNIDSDYPDTAAWGIPTMLISNDKCNINNHFKDQRLVINIDFCGVLAGEPNIWGGMCKASTGHDVCSSYVAENPSAFSDVYFKVKDIRIFKEGSKPVVSSTVSSSASASASQSASVSVSVISVSASGSVSEAASVSASSTASVSESASLSQSSSAQVSDKSVSVSDSASVTATATASASGSVTASASVSESASATVTASASGSVTASASVSGSVTEAATSSASVTASISGSASASTGISESGSVSDAATGSASVSQSSSQPASVSISVSGSVSDAATGTITASAGLTQTGAASTKTGTVSGSVSDEDVCTDEDFSQTVTNKQTQTAIPGNSGSQTATDKQTQTSVTPSQSDSQGVTNKASQTSAPSVTSKTVSATGSVTDEDVCTDDDFTQTVTNKQTQTSVPTQSGSQSLTEKQTQTSVPVNSGSQIVTNQQTQTWVPTQSGSQTFTEKQTQTSVPDRSESQLVTSKQTQTSIPALGSSTEVDLTTSTVYTTKVSTITACPPSVTNCPGRIGQVVTETIALYTTICPVTDVPGPKPTEPVRGNDKPKPNPGPGPIPAPVPDVSTTVLTKTYVITKCPSTVPDCPIGSVTTKIITQTNSVPVVTRVPTGGVPVPVVTKIPTPPTQGAPPVATKILSLSSAPGIIPPPKPTGGHGNGTHNGGGNKPPVAPGQNSTKPIITKPSTLTVTKPIGTASPSKPVVIANAAAQAGVSFAVVALAAFFTL